MDDAGLAEVVFFAPFALFGDRMALLGGIPLYIVYATLLLAFAIAGKAIRGAAVIGGVHYLSMVVLILCQWRLIADEAASIPGSHWPIVALAAIVFVGLQLYVAEWVGWPVRRRTARRAADAANSA